MDKQALLNSFTSIIIYRRIMKVMVFVAMHDYLNRMIHYLVESNSWLIGALKI